MSDDDALIRDLERTLGNKELAKQARESILKLRDGAGGGQLAEMARDLIDGRIGLRTVGTSSAYAEPLTAAASRYGEWFRNLDPEEQAAFMADARAELSRIERQEAETTPDD